MNVLQRIPFYVPIILLALVALGLQQSRARVLPVRRLLAMNLVLSVVTLAAVAQQWRGTPWLALAIASWAVGCLLLTFLLGQRAAPPGAAYDAQTKRFAVPGSWWPMALFMLIFATKFAIGMADAMAPGQLRNMASALGISTLYGLYSGILNARAWALLKLKDAR
jgi:hypothetical protein